MIRLLATSRKEHPGEPLPVRRIGYHPIQFDLAAMLLVLLHSVRPVCAVDSIRVDPAHLPRNRKAKARNVGQILT